MLAIQQMSALTALILFLQCSVITEGVGLVGDTCSADLNCTVANSFCLKNTVCQLGICRCKTGFVNLDSTNSTCAPGPIQVGGACSSSVQCGAGAQCESNTTCQCLVKYRLAADNTTCLKGDFPLNEICSSINDCGALANCTANPSTKQCICISPYQPSEENSYDCRYLSIYEGCSTSNDGCNSAAGLACDSSSTMCQCPSGQVWSNVPTGTPTPGYQCIDPSAIFDRAYGQTCDDLTTSCANAANPVMCGVGLACNECPENAGSCSRKCLIDSDVTYCLSNPCQNSGTCTNNPGGYTCACKVGWSGVHCELFTGSGLIGETCTLDGTRQCTVPNSYCLKSSLCQLGTCQCSTGYIYLNSTTNSTCVAARLDIGSTCVNSLQCGLNAECRGSSRLACQCIPSSQMDMNGIDCTLGVFPIGNSCFSDGDCGALAICQGGVCACSNSDYVPSGQFGCRYLTYNETCTTANNGCNTNAGLSCDAGSNTCQCSSGRVWTNAVNGLPVLGYQCVDVSAIFSRTYGNDCADYTTGCGVVGNLRACIAGLMCNTCPEDVGTCSNQCLIDKSQQYCLSSPCQNGGTCINLPSAYSCGCPIGWSGANCERTVGNGLVGSLCTLNGISPCTAVNSYCLKNTVCQLGTCQCAPGYVNLDNTNSTCVQDNVQVGQPCQATVQCGIGATCSASTCRCPVNFRTSLNGIDCLRGTVQLNSPCSLSDFPARCGVNAYCSSNVCVCLNTEHQPSEENSFDCRSLSNGEPCTPSAQACDASVGLTCNVNTSTCQCPSGQVWGYVPSGVSTPGYQCSDPASTYGQTYGQSCHDLLSTCSASTQLQACTPDLVCDECPEDANSCNRKCLAIDNSTVTTTAAPTTTTATTTTTVITTTAIIGSSTTTTAGVDSTSTSTGLSTNTAGSTTTTTVAGSSVTTTAGSSITTAGSSTTTAGSSTTTAGSSTTTAGSSTTTAGSSTTTAGSSTTTAGSSTTTAGSSTTTAGSSTTTAGLATTTTTKAPTTTIGGPNTSVASSATSTSSAASSPTSPNGDTTIAAVTAKSGCERLIFHWAALLITTLLLL